MSQRREKRIRKLEKRVADLEHQVCMNHWLYKPYSQTEVVGPDGNINFKPDIASSLDYVNKPLDADYAPIPTGHKPGFFRRMWKKIFG